MMGMLDGLVGQIAKQAINGQGSTASGGSGLADMIGGMVGSAMTGQRPRQHQSQNPFERRSNTNGVGAVLGNIIGGQLGGGKGAVLAALMPLVLNWIQQQGGISKAFESLTNNGMQHQAQSWMNADQANEPISANEVVKLFDQEQIAQVARQTNTNETEVKAELAELLPEVFNQLTPTGDTSLESEANSEIDDLLGELSGMLAPK